MNHETYIPEDRIYRTTDFALAVVLSLVYPILAVDTSDPEETWFTIERGEITDEYIRRYQDNQLCVEPHDLINHLVDLHDRMKDNHTIIC